MPSPFPGMDPYLEAYWGDVHTSLVTYARDQLAGQLPAGLKVRIEEYISVEEDDQPRRKHRVPDVHIRESDSAAAPTLTAVATLDDEEEVLLLPIEREPQTQREIRIVDHRDGDRLVTAIEFLSITNKTSGRSDYRAKQRQLLEGDVNLVEIDLLRTGHWVIAPSERDIPAQWMSPYRISVYRTVPNEANWYYAASFKKRLPAIRIPLRAGDPLARLDLQSLVDRAYLNGGYETLDYTREPIPPLPPTDAAWVDDWLRKQGRR
jgi:hypothetical protein